MTTDNWALRTAGRVKYTSMLTTYMPLPSMIRFGFPKKWHKVNEINDEELADLTLSVNSRRALKGCRASVASGARQGGARESCAEVPERVRRAGGG